MIATAQAFSGLEAHILSHDEGQDPAPESVWVCVLTAVTVRSVSYTGNGVVLDLAEGQQVWARGLLVTDGRGTDLARSDALRAGAIDILDADGLTRDAPDDRLPALRTPGAVTEVTDNTFHRGQGGVSLSPGSPILTAVRTGLR